MFFDQLERIFKGMFVIAVVVLGMSFFQKDKLPEPEFFSDAVLSDPLQTPTNKAPFQTQINNQVYTITPLFDYHLSGVVVTDYESGSLGDIYHHRQWKDFLNVKDLCVVFGKNVQSDVFRKLRYRSGPWTCFFQIPDQQTGKQFRSDQLSNNHILTDNIDLHRLVMRAAPGDEVRISGMLANYQNQATGFERETSISRTDTGNGACETIFVTDFSITKKANHLWRMMYRVAGWAASLAILGFIATLLVRPVKRLYR
ncbi:MAG: hypothetical protein GY922_05460 [Proteobacteria bacterium]|nr:hypothetical protein [Pseudomonadota bacterium]